VTLLLALSGCAGEPAADTAAVDCESSPDVDWTGFAHGFVTTYCVSCHSVNNTERRYGAPEGLDFDTEADVYASAARIRVRTLDEETMPPGGGVFADDLELLDIYLTCALGE
jgi:uncharacterized membrane protein